MDLSFITSIIVDILLIPLQFILIPLDALLSNIPGISAIPDALSSVLYVIGTIPSTMVVLLGANPILWNAVFLLFVLYIGAAPAIQLVKRIWAWIRP
jgi:hypothetical protein